MEYLDSVIYKNIEIMNQLNGFQVIIICCSSIKQAYYWQERLESGKGSIISIDCTVLAVDEDWPGGAGNGILIHTNIQNESSLYINILYKYLVDLYFFIYHYE